MKSLKKLPSWKRIIDNIKKQKLVGDKFMPEMHLKQLEFTYSGSGSLLKTKSKYKNLKKLVYGSKKWNKK